MRRNDLFRSWLDTKAIAFRQPNFNDSPQHGVLLAFYYDELTNLAARHRKSGEM